jgi:cytochrome b561
MLLTRRGNLSDHFEVWSMYPENAGQRYGWVSVSLHWLMLILIVAAYATMEFKSIFPKGSASRQAMTDWHYMLGLSVFALVWLRLITRVAGSDPAIEPPLPPWQSRSRTAMHCALYVLMIGIPLLGLMTLNAKGTPVALLGYDFPVLIGKSQVAAKGLKEVHEILARAGYLLIGLHAIAALLHHYVRRDNTLRRMLYRRYGSVSNPRN